MGMMQEKMKKDERRGDVIAEPEHQRGRLNMTERLRVKRTTAGDRRPRRTLRTTSPCKAQLPRPALFIPIQSVRHPLTFLQENENHQLPRQRLGNLVYHKTRKMIHNSILCITGETQSPGKSNNQKKKESPNSVQRSGTLRS